MFPWELIIGGWVTFRAKHWASNNQNEPTTAPDNGPAHVTTALHYYTNVPNESKGQMPLGTPTALTYPAFPYTTNLHFKGDHTKPIWFGHEGYDRTLRVHVASTTDTLQ